MNAMLQQNENREDEKENNLIDILDDNLHDTNKG